MRIFYVFTLQMSIKIIIKDKFTFVDDCVWGKLIKVNIRSAMVDKITLTGWINN